MTEVEARQWIVERFGVPRETLLKCFIDLVVAESQHQNLISQATLSSIWLRHVVDSAQLIPLADAQAPDEGAWIDIGTGAGFPGVIAAILTDRPVMLIEPRRKRAEFLASSVRALGLEDKVTVIASKSQQATGSAAIISARAVAPIADLFASAHHLSTKKTLWVLPKGINAMEEVAIARRTWHAAFHVEHSTTQLGSLIVIATGVSRR